MEPNIIQWKVVGLSPKKMTELRKILTDRVVLLANEANITTENMQYYKTKHYSTYSFFKGRQITSGILVTIKNSII